MFIVTDYAALMTKVLHNFGGVYMYQFVDKYIFRWRADGCPPLYTGWVLEQIKSNEFRLYELALIFRRRNGSLAMVISVCYMGHSLVQ